MPKSSRSNSKAGAANALHETLQAVPGLPEKVKIFKVDCSRYWWARVYINGRYRTKSLKTEKLREAQEAAKKFFIQAIIDAEHLSDGKNVGKSMSRSFIVVGKNFVESQNVPDKVRRYNDDRIRFNKELVPHFKEKDIGDIAYADIGALVKKMQEGGKSPATINQYLIVLRKIFKFAADNRLIQTIPSFPKVKGRNAQTKRDYFEMKEYKKLVSVIEEMAAEGVKVRGVPVTLEYKYLVQFMVNSFIRPSDLRVLRHQHVKVMTNNAAKAVGDKKYLLLSHPATKTTDQEVVTMPAAFGVYENLLKLQNQRFIGPKHQKAGKPKDYVFFPEYPNRNTMIAVAGRIFAAVIERAKMKQEGEKHTLYSLRHTSIMYRLLKGDVDTLTLAKNARTSQAMIEKFYASRLTALMNLDKLHSFK